MVDIPSGINTTGQLTIGVNNGFSEVLEVAGDTDWYRVTLTAGFTYAFSMAGADVGAVEGVADPFLRLHSSTGVELASDDDGAQNDLNALLIYAPTVTGTYFLNAGAFMNLTAGGYRILSLAVDGPDDLRGDTTTTRVLTIGGTVAANIDYAFDVDVVRVTLTAGTTYLFQAQGRDSGNGTLVDPYLEVADSNNNVLFFDDDGGAGTDARLLFTPTTSGTYFVAAFDPSFETGSYRFSAAVAVSNATSGDANANNLVGDAGGNAINGLGGNDTISGLGGNDTLNGGTGVDRLLGGAGDDIFLVDQESDVVVEGANEGDDAVIASSNFYLYANIERLTQAAGAGDVYGVGNALPNTIAGNEGQNLLIGGAESDTISGNGGVDQLFGEAGDDQLRGDAGIDYLVGGAGNDDLDGGADPDALYGEAGDDLLTGGAGFVTDILVGGDGADTLDGDSGLSEYDIMNGAAGDDEYRVDTPADLTFEAAGGGVDTVYANITATGYQLYPETENLVLEGVTPFGVGNELANRMTGNASANVLLSGAGNDTLNGGASGDVLFGEAGVDEFVFERGTGGDVIGDFTAGVDRVRLIVPGFESFVQVQANLIQNGGTSALNLGNGDFIVFQGVAIAALTAADFAFG